VRARIGEPRTFQYGEMEVESLDVYGAATDKLFVFVHGGAWKRMARRGNAFAAETIIAAGAAYVVVGFSLLPAVTLPRMASQVLRALTWLQARFKPRTFVLCGHSSGAHLSACALTQIDFVHSALLVSGPYDLLPVRLSARNAYVRLDEKLEQEYSPIRHVERIRCPVTVAWAQYEGAEFARQSREFAAALQREGKLAAAIEGMGLNHFEIIETLADPRAPLGAAALRMLQ
jgi:arylformamidase